MALVRDGDADYDAIYDKWLEEDRAGWVIYAGVHYEKKVDVAGVIAFASYTTTALVDSRSLSGSKAATYTKLDDGGHDV